METAAGGGEFGHGRKTTAAAANNVELMIKKKGPWTREEDQKLLDYIREHGGHGSWRSLPAKAGLERRGKSCRLRWTNYLRPDIRRGKFNPHEEKTIIRLHALLGNRWSAIAPHLPKRTENEIKNYWNTRLKKRLSRMGIDPSTHRPKAKHAADISHMAQWEAARLQAEARLTRNESHLPPHRNKPTAATQLSPSPRPRLMAVLPCLDILKVWQANNTTTTQTSCISTSALECFSSPTSSLSCSSGPAVPTTSPLLASTISTNNNNNACHSLPAITSMNMNNPYLENHHLDSSSNEYDIMTSSMDDLVAHNYNNSEGYEDIDGAMFGGWFQDTTMDCWNDLVNLVNTPALESPWAF